MGKRVSGDEIKAYHPWSRCLLAAKCLGGYQVQPRVDTKHTESRDFF